MGPPGEDRREGVTEGLHSSSAPSLTGPQAGTALPDRTEDPACWPPTRPGPQPVTAMSPLTVGGCGDHSVTYGLFCAPSGWDGGQPLSSESGMEGRQEAPTTRCAGQGGLRRGRSAGSGAGGVETVPYVCAACEAGAGPGPSGPAEAEVIRRPRPAGPHARTRRPARGVGADLQLRRGRAVACAKSMPARDCHAC